MGGLYLIKKLNCIKNEINITKRIYEIYLILRKN